MLVTLGMTAVTYGIVTTDRLSWGSPGVLAPLVAGVSLLGSFALYEGRVAREPLMPLSVFRLRTLRAANVVIFLLYAAIFGFWFFQSLYMQGTLHFSALETGLAFVPMTLGVGLGATLAPRLTRRVGARMVLAAGMLSATAGEALLTGVHPGGTYVAQVLPGGMLGAFGLGLSLVPATIVAVQGVPAATSGLASGVLNTSRFVGAALGLAVLSTIAASHTHAALASGASTATALTDGFQFQFGVGAVFCLVGAAAALVMLRPERVRCDRGTGPGGRARLASQGRAGFRAPVRENRRMRRFPALQSRAVGTGVAPTPPDATRRTECAFTGAMERGSR